MKVYTPPEFPDITGKFSIFLGGSIEMGGAKKWQDEFIKKADYRTTNYSRDILGKWVILNPRRSDWDSSWKQTIKDPQFFQQVTWELTYLERAIYRVFYFAKDTLSPITLLEFGKFCSHPNTYVCWEEGYLRAGNLEVFCNKFDIPYCNNMDDLVAKIPWYKG